MERFWRLSGQEEPTFREMAMKIGSTHRVMVRPLALLALACAVSLFIGVEGAAAQSDDIDEAVNAHGVTPTLELTPAQGARSIRKCTKTRASRAEPVCHPCRCRSTPDDRALSVAGRYSSQQSRNQVVQVHRGRRRGRTRRSDNNACYRCNRPEAEATIGDRFDD